MQFSGILTGTGDKTDDRVVGDWINTSKGELVSWCGRMQRVDGLPIASGTYTLERDDGTTRRVHVLSEMSIPSDPLAVFRGRGLLLWRPAGSTRC
jgi:hypothetical protein